MESKIIKQVEFYFGDSNLPTDKFLQSVIQENDGWVPVETLLTFKRLRQLTEKPSEIVDALRLSESGLLEIDEEGTKVKRSKAPESDILKQALQSVYIKGFKETSTLEEIESFLEENIKDKKILCVRMRRIPTSKVFKGSVFVEFSSVKEAEEVASMSLTFDEKPMILMMKNDYVQKKTEERKAKKSALDGEKKLGHQTNGKRKQVEETIAKGSFLKFSQAITEGTSREDLTEIFSKYGEIAWIDFQRGDSSGFIRYSDSKGPTSAMEDYEKNGAKLVVKDAQLTIELASQDEEKVQIEKIIEAKQNRQSKGNVRGKRGFKRGNFKNERSSKRSKAF
eukprot:Sdes_comp22390_c0_seq1m20856